METESLLDILVGLEKSVDQLNGLTRDAEIKEIGDGNLNFVYRVTWNAESPPSGLSHRRSVIVKHAPTYIRCLGPEYGLTQGRLKVEYDALCRFHSVAPGSCPQPYYFGRDSTIMIMEDLESFSVMRAEVVAGNVNATVVCSVAKLAATVHRTFHRDTLADDEWRQLCADFSNDDMVDITRQYLFVRPFDADDPTNKSPPVARALAAEMRASEPVRRRVEDLRRAFLEQRESLMHGDLHCGSVMVNGNEARVFDAEFACVGPAAFEIGMFLIQFCVSWLAHKHGGRPDADSVLAALEDATRNAWETYRKHFFPDDVTDDVVARFWHDAVGFGACEATRRVIGAAPIPDLSSDAALLAVLKLCFRILSGTPKIGNVDELVAVVKLLD